MSNLVLPPLPGIVVRSREPYYGDQIVEAVSGKEFRSSWWFTPRCRYRLGYDFLRSNSLAELQTVAGFFSRHFGRLDSFLFTDPEDCAVTDHGFGVGNGVTTVFQLQRSHAAMGSVYDKTGGPWVTSSKPRANVLVRSQEFNDGSWVKTYATVGANLEIAPDGTATADRLSEDVTGSPQSHRVLRSSIIASGSKIVSIFAKAGTRTKMRVRVGFEPTTQGGVFDLSAGTATDHTGGSASIVQLSGGWYRCIVVCSVVADPNVYIDLLNDAGSDTYNGVANKYIYIWGAQLEVGSVVTSYIATGASAATSTPGYYPLIGDGFEPVWDPGAGLQIYVNGTLQTPTTHYTVGANGVITFVSPPASAAVLSWTGNYYKRVRFAEPGMTFERVVSQWYKAGTVDLVSVKP